MRKEVLSFDAPKLNYAEVARYLGVKIRGEASCTEDSELDKIHDLISECYEISKPSLKYDVCFMEISKKDAADFAFAELEYFNDCKGFIVFGATVGVGFDRLINKYSSLSVSKAAVLQALGAERIETLCDAFEKIIVDSEAKKGNETKRRISPGYGKFSLDMQSEIFNLLNLPKEIGLTLNESLMMSPSKSVTAIIGIREGNTGCRDDREKTECNNKCIECAKVDCAFRK